ARHNIPMSSHMAPEYSVHLLSATPTADWLEFVDWGAELIRDPLRVRDGTAVAPDRIGSGIEWNDAVVADAFVAERTIP
ncbi:MAG: enolase C-terminal domain-like protein, partial [Pseudomonadota bacterium]